MPVPSWFPTDPVNPGGYSAKLAQLGDKGIANVSTFLSKRNLIVFADLWDRVQAIDDVSIRRVILGTLTSIFTIVSERQGYFGGGGGMSGNLYMPIVRMEKNIYDVLQRKLTKLIHAERRKQLHHKSHVATSTASAQNLLTISDNSIDYIYTDPPFGANIIYTEMNLTLEAWLKAKTNESEETVIDETRNRDFHAYAQLLRDAFTQFYRILKPGRWMTVEFHNTKASIWNLIQTAIGESGFVVAQVGVLDKGSTTILADIRPGAAKRDLLISAYKPSRMLEEQFRLRIATEDGVWDFVQTHLQKLPVVVCKADGVAVNPERQRHLLFDRMVAFHVQRGMTIPVAAAAFYRGLAERYDERDGMFFLEDQTPLYDSARRKAAAVRQLPLVVRDEETAIHWVQQQLHRLPQTTEELAPKFARELGDWDRHEKPITLNQLLQENFICYEDQDQFPAEPELLAPDASEPSGAPPRKWHVPDSLRAAELQRLREESLLREFSTYFAAEHDPPAVFRFEAIRAGFRKAWQNHDYSTIIGAGRRLPQEILQEDPILLMWFDHALARVGGSR